MLKVSRQTDYAARIVLHLAQLGGGMTTIARMVQVNHLPASFVRRLVVQLEKGGLVVTLRGRKGGIRLARPAAQISLLDVVSVMERPFPQGVEPGVGPARPVSTWNPVLEAWLRASRVLEASLAAVRFDGFLGEAGLERVVDRGFLRPTGS